MEIEIQKEIKHICKVCEHLPNDTLEAYLEYAALYSMKYWLILQGEFLRRMEEEISKI